MSDFPNVITEVAWTTDPAATPTWVDESASLKSLRTDRGRDSELDDVQPGTATYVFNNTARRFDNVSGANAGNVLPMKRIRSRIPGPLQGLEFWGDFECGSEVEWTNSDIGGAEYKTGDPLSDQFSVVTTPTPRLGAKIGQFTVGPGDVFPGTSGERMLLRRDIGPAFGISGATAIEGQRVYYSDSVRFKSPWTMPSGGSPFGIFIEHHSDSQFGQAPFKFRVNTTTGALELRVNTGDFANTTDATAGSPCTFDATYTLWPGPLSVDQWFDLRWMILWTKNRTGRVVVDIKLDTDTAWKRAVDVAQVQTIPSIAGASLGGIKDLIGWYRSADSSINVLFHDGFQVGHSWDEVSYSAPVMLQSWDEITRGPAFNIDENPDFEVDTVGTSSAGGGVTTRSSSTDRAKFGTHSLKHVTDGAASAQGSLHTKRSGSRFDVTAGQTYTAAAWFSGDGGERVRIGIEYFDGASASLGTTYAKTRTLRTAWRRHVITVVAPAGAVTARVRTGLNQTSASTFYVDGVGFWAGDMDAYLFDGYFESLPQTWPDRLFDAEVQATVADGFKPLNLYLLANNGGGGGIAHGLPSVVGAEAAGELLGVYGRSLLFDQPYICMPFWEGNGTEVTNFGSSGQTGAYKATPTLGQASLLLGSQSSSVRFTRANSEYVGGMSTLGKFADNHESPGGFTIEYTWQPASIGTTQVLVSGEYDTTDTNDRYNLFIDTATNKITFRVRGLVTGVQTTKDVVSTAAVTVGTTNHLIARYDPVAKTIDLRVNGTLVTPVALGAGWTGLGNASGTTIRVGYQPEGGTSYADGGGQYFVVFDYVLSDARSTAHYAAAVQGFPNQLAGARVNAVLDLIGSWGSATRWVQAGQRTVLQNTYQSQSALDEIRRAETAESGLYFQAARGVPTFLDRDWRTRVPYTTSQATFGDDPTVGELPYETIVFSNDESFLYNEIRTTRTGADLPQIVSDATSKTKYLTRPLELSDVAVTTDADALAISTALLAKYNDPMQRVTSISFPVAGSDADLDHQVLVQQALYREIGDQITTKRRPKGGTVITQASYVERVRHDIDFENDSWDMTLAVSPR